MKIYRKGLNTPQNLAVKNIIQGSSQPHPFILLGLAGNCYQKKKGLMRFLSVINIRRNISKWLRRFPLDTHKNQNDFYFQVPERRKPSLRPSLQ